MVLARRHVSLRKMKVLFNTGVFGKHGIEHALVNILPELPQTEYKYILHQIYEPDSPSPLLNNIKSLITQDISLPRDSFWGNLHMNRKKSIFHKLLDSIGLIKIHNLIANHINDHHPDVVVDYDLSLLRSAHLITAPKIGFFHFRPKRFRNGGTAKLKRIGKRLTYYQKLVVLCDEMHQEACEVWPHLKDKLIVLPNSINLPLVIQKSEGKSILPPNVIEKEYFISIARLTHQKNIHLLLNAYKCAKDFGCSWKLILVGEGEDRADLETIKEKLNLNNDVFFVGYQENPYPYLKQSGALVLSSREEGFGLVLLEAMALKCPTISLACPTGPSDILQNGKLGKLVEFSEADPDQLGLAMLALSTDEYLRSSYSENSYEWCHNFSSSKIATKLLDLIKDCDVKFKTN